MRLLDLFCGAGGAAMGYSQAGFDVVGVDATEQPRYPFEFVRADALNPTAAGIALSEFDAIHASPPCQAYTSLRSLQKGRAYPDLIAATRELLETTGLPYVIENVERARRHLVDPIYICGSMFDPPMDVQRHRYFEANWPLSPPMWPCRHKLWDFRYRSLDRRAGRRGLTAQGDGHEHSLSRVVGVHGHLNYAGEGELRKRAMGIDWMTQAELAEAIPPAYTELVGRQLLAHITTQAAAATGAPSRG